MSRLACRRSNAANSREPAAPGAPPIRFDRLRRIHRELLAPGYLQHRIALCSAVAILWLSFAASARAETPLYEEEPYDQITLDAANDNTVFKVKPLDLPDRRTPPA